MAPTGVIMVSIRHRRCRAFTPAFHRYPDAARARRLDWRQRTRMQATSLSRHHREERGSTGLTVEEELRRPPPTTSTSAEHGLGGGGPPCRPTTTVPRRRSTTEP
jgi:hypothetical protein